METSVAGVVNAHHLLLHLRSSLSSVAISNAKYSQSFEARHGGLRLEKSSRANRNREVKCTTGASVSLPEKQQQRQFGAGDEIITEEEVMAMGLGRVGVGDKCKEVRGVVELLECLESEAIMGEDEGKDPTDYNRRAQIFDKSSRVFQALKEKNV